MEAINITIKYDGVDNNGGYNGDSNKKYLLDTPKLMYLSVLFTSILKTNSLTDLSTSVTQIMFEYNRIDNSGSCNGDFDRRFHPKL